MEKLKEMPFRNPLNGTFELTVRCNLKCKMCLFRHDDSENNSIIANERTTKEWIDLAKQVADAGTLQILITGGEPMLREDFCEIYEAIYKMGFLVVLYTNATMVTPKIINLLKKHPPHKIGITLYGASPETYQNVCGSSKAFQKAIDGMNQLNTLPSKLEVRSTIIKDNYNDIDKMRNLVKENLGYHVPFNITRMVFKPVRGGCAKVEECRLTPKENTQLLIDRVSYIAEEYGINCMSQDKIRFGVEKQEPKNYYPTLYGCNAGINSYTITWDGKLSSCQILEDATTNPFCEGFSKAWIELPKRVKISPLNSKCSNCNDQILCSTCVATRLAETGDVSGYPEYICNNIKELKKILIDNLEGE